MRGTDISKYQKYHFCCCVIECMDDKLSNLVSRIDMEKNGWNTTNMNNFDGNDETCCKERECTYPQCTVPRQCTFYGSLGGNDIGSISTIFKGSGKAILSYGNCYPEGNVLVFLNDKELDRTSSLESQKAVSFRFRKGDVLKIEEDLAVIKLYSFVLQDCGKP